MTMWQMMSKRPNLNRWLTWLRLRRREEELPRLDQAVCVALTRTANDLSTVRHGRLIRGQRAGAIATH